MPRQNSKLCTLTIGLFGLDHLTRDLVPHGRDTETEDSPTLNTIHIFILLNSYTRQRLPDNDNDTRQDYNTKERLKFEFDSRGPAL